MSGSVQQAGRVLVVGVGDDGPDSLPASVLGRVEQAQVLAGGRRHLDLFPDHPGARLVIAGDLNAVIQQIANAAQAQRVVVLASGDPCFFGIGPLLAQRLGRDRLEIVPNVSSVALACARLGVGWQDARVVSAHGRPLASAVESALGAHKLAVLTDDENTPSAVAAALLHAGAQDAPAWVFEHLGGHRERSIQSTLTGLVGEAFAALNVLVVPRLTWIAPSDCGRHLFGLPETRYAHSQGMITKPEVRAVSLSKLRLPANGVLWDVGAASGSVSIEATNLIPGVTAYAIERSETQLQHLRHNVSTQTTGTSVCVVAGTAPEVFPNLPDPDAVFVGGSGGNLGVILSEASDRLKRDGRIVCNLVTIENLAEALRWAEARGVPAEIVQVNVARGTDIMRMTRLQADNPVSVVTIRP